MKGKIPFETASVVFRGNAVDMNLGFADAGRRRWIGEEGKRLHGYFTGLAEDLQSEDYIQARADMVEAIRAKDKDAVTAFKEVVAEMTTNIVLATSNWLPFFRVHTLNHNDRAEVINETNQEIGVSIIGIDGKADRVRAVKEFTAEPVRMLVLATDVYEYPLFDLDKGFDVRDAALVQVDLARDLAAQVDAMLAQYILVGTPNSMLTAAFQTTGAMVSRDYHAHSRVNTANFPAGNLLTLDGNSTTTKLRLDVFKAIVKYQHDWGSGAFPDGDIMAQTIIVPSSDTTGFLDEIATIDVNDNEVTRQIFNGGVPVNYGGQTWRVIGDNTLDPNDGMAYVQTNKPVGEFYQKPSLDQTLLDDSFDRKINNSEAVAMTKVVGAATSRHHRPHLIGVRYRTPA